MLERPGGSKTRQSGWNPHDPTYFLAELIHCHLVLTATAGDNLVPRKTTEAGCPHY